MSDEFDELQVEDNHVVSEGDVAMDPTHPDWTVFVTSELTEDEQYNGIPRTDGLRRLVEKFVGRIISIHVNMQCTMANTMYMIATATITLEDGSTYQACADANMFNTSGDFQNKLAAMADTRAKGKCYREILRLKNTVTEDEHTPNEKSEDCHNTPITETQIQMIRESIPRQVKGKTGKELDYAAMIADNFDGKELHRLSLNEAGIMIQLMQDFKKGKVKEEISKYLLDNAVSPEVGEEEVK